MSRDLRRLLTSDRGQKHESAAAQFVGFSFISPYNVALVGEKDTAEISRDRVLFACFPV